MTRYHLVYWFEAVAVAAFGWSWLTKGETFLRDKPVEHRPVSEGEQI